jgi:PPP family 3-phenylpropionic acid transporter
LDVASVAPSRVASSIRPRLRLFYFLYYASVGIVHPFFTPYLRGLGFSGDPMGTVQMAGAIAAAPAALVWAVIADRLGLATRALKLSTLATLAAVSWLPWARTPRSVGLVLVAQGLVAPAIVPLVDTVTVESQRRAPDASYARIRAFGSLGYVCASLALGLLLSARGDQAGDPAVPFAYAACVLSFAAIALVLPSAPSPGRPPRVAEMLSLLGDRRLILLITAGAMHSMTSAAYQLYGVLVRDEGLPATVTGLGMAFGVCAEVLVLFAFPWLERRFSVGTLLAAAFAGTSLRWYLLSESHAPASLIGLQVFHGLTFGLYWGASVKGMSDLVPSRLRATGQALYSAVAFSIGGAVGYRLVGYGYDRLGGAGPVYGWAAVLEVVPFGLALALAASRI